MKLQNANKKIEALGGRYDAVVNFGMSRAWVMPNGYCIQMCSQDGSVLCYHVFSPNHKNEAFCTVYSIKAALHAASADRVSITAEGVRRAEESTARTFAMIEGAGK